MAKAILIGPDNWQYNQLSIARHYGGIRIDGEEYFIDGASNYLVRHDWAGVVKAAGIERTKSLIRSGYTTASSAMAVIRKEKAEEKTRKKAPDDRQTKLF
jgi:hypothetical protein